MQVCLTQLVSDIREGMSDSARVRHPGRATRYYIEGDGIMREKEPKKEDRRVRRTKKMLTQALTSLLAQKQINEITVKELTDLADINRGTFYLYYRDVFDMLSSIEDELFSEFDVLVDPADLENGTMTQASVLVDVFDFVKENQEMCRVLLSANGDMNFLHRLNEVLREKFLRIWHTIPSRNDDEFAYHYSFLVFGCAGMLREWVNQGCRESSQYMAELAESMLRLAAPQ